mmetsp:Transcript_32930/g.63250  ORF Transcript_32930/g.63250 Transcript_32930/m.63250 type:complete len:308 (+) Transcript_32930:751-1674(+)
MQLLPVRPGLFTLLQNLRHGFLRQVQHLVCLQHPIHEAVSDKLFVCIPVLRLNVLHLLAPLLRDPLLTLTWHLSHDGLEMAGHVLQVSSGLAHNAHGGGHRSAHHLGDVRVSGSREALCGVPPGLEAAGVLVQQLAHLLVLLHLNSSARHALQHFFDELVVKGRRHLGNRVRVERMHKHDVFLPLRPPGLPRVILEQILPLGHFVRHRHLFCHLFALLKNRRQVRAHDLGLLDFGLLVQLLLFVISQCSSIAQRKASRHVCKLLLALLRLQSLCRLRLSQSRVLLGLVHVLDRLRQQPHLLLRLLSF